MRISDGSSDVCSSDLPGQDGRADDAAMSPAFRIAATAIVRDAAIVAMYDGMVDRLRALGYRHGDNISIRFEDARADTARAGRSEERSVGKEWVSTCRSRWSPDH